MSIRFYQITVLCFWISTVAWLLATKVMPVLHRGEPPNHHAATVAHLIDNVPVIWDMKWNFHSVGWAANHVVKTPEGQLELLSRLQFTDWPKADAMSSSWLLEQLSDWGGPPGDFNLRLTNRSLLDNDYQLQQLDSSIHLGMKQSAQNPPWMQIQGKVDGNALKLSFQLGNRTLGERTIPIRPTRSALSGLPPPRREPSLPRSNVTIR